jgi:hypothetical protein
MAKKEKASLTEAVSAELRLMLELGAKPKLWPTQLYQ